MGKINYRKILEYILIEKKKNKQLKAYLELCPFTMACSESNYGDGDVCKEDYKFCKRYKTFLGSNMAKYMERLK